VAAKAATKNTIWREEEQRLLIEEQRLLIEEQQFQIDPPHFRFPCILISPPVMNLNGLWSLHI
jgi:hypothetical protein